MWSELYSTQSIFSRPPRTRYEMSAAVKRHASAVVETSRNWRSLLDVSVMLACLYCYSVPTVMLVYIDTQYCVVNNHYIIIA